MACGKILQEKMMNRYDASAGEIPEAKEAEKVPSNFPPYVEPFELWIRFDPEHSVWYLRIKRENDKDWATVRSDGPDADPRDRRVEFQKRDQAEAWCKEKGLIF